MVAQRTQNCDCGKQGREGQRALCCWGARGVVALKEADILCGCCLRAQLRFKRTRIQLRTSKTHGHHQLVVWISKSSVRVVSSQHFSRNTEETNEVLFCGDSRMTKYDFLKCPIRQLV